MKSYGSYLPSIQNIKSSAIKSWFIPQKTSKIQINHHEIIRFISKKTSQNTYNNHDINSIATNSWYIPKKTPEKPPKKTSLRAAENATFSNVFGRWLAPAPGPWPATGVPGWNPAPWTTMTTHGAWLVMVIFQLLF